MMHSIRLRLLFFVGGLMILTWLGTAATSIYSARKEVQELFDAHLAHSARVLHAILLHEISEVEAAGLDNRSIVLDTSVPGHFYEGEFFFTVRDDQGKARYRSLQAPDLQIQPQVSGFTDITDSRQQWFNGLYAVVAYLCKLEDIPNVMDYARVLNMNKIVLYINLM